jgi:hypothetical protein
MKSRRVLSLWSRATKSRGHGLAVRTTFACCLPCAAYGAEPPLLPTSRELDAQIDQYIVVPSAEVHPEQTLYLSASDGVAWQLGYAALDNLQLSATFWTLPPWDVELLMFTGSAKVVAYRDAKFQLSAQGSYFHFQPTDVTPPPNAVQGGLYFRFCYQQRCRGSVQLGLNVLAGLDVNRRDFNGEGGNLGERALGAVTTLSWQQRLGWPQLSLLSEALVPFSVYGKSLPPFGFPSATVPLLPGVKFLEPFAFAVGVRWANSKWALSLAAIQLVTFEHKWEAELSPLPWLSATYRIDLAAHAD